jgi:hypothetical protein
VIPQISPGKFLWEKYIAKQGISQLCIVDSAFEELQPGVKILGWCWAKDLPVRPRTEGKAILVEFEDGPDIIECWLHCFEELPQ